MQQRIENKTFNELKSGDTARLVRTLAHKDIEGFAIMSEDLEGRSALAAKVGDAQFVAREKDALSPPQPPCSMQMRLRGIRRS